MDHATQVTLVRRILTLLEARATELAPAPYVNRVTTYTSATQLERERALLFRGEPLLVGLSGDVPEPGSYLVHAEAGVPVLIVRSASGTLRAFLDVCRHRGAQVVTGAGKSTGRFTCPYHGWVYDEDGRVVAQPCSEGFAGLGDTLCLAKLPVAERHGMIFVRATAGDPIDADAQLGGAEQELAPLGLERYVPFARHQTERAINWKLAVDTFLEAYHVPSLHQQSLAPTILGAPALWDAFGRSGRLVAVRRSITELRSRPEAEWSLLEHAVVLWGLFPNTVLIHQIDHVELVQAHPGAGGPDTSRIVFRLYTPGAVREDAARRHFQANFDLLVRTVEGEDFHVCEQIQRGFHAGGPGVVVYGRNEPGLAHYHRMIDRTLGVDNAGTV
jgi:phenylpropionate dioxygenase-like ring-hydroxylating dioxygenase large terminal subunit